VIVAHQTSCLLILQKGKVSCKEERLRTGGALSKGAGISKAPWDGSSMEKDRLLSLLKSVVLAKSDLF
jgi:hypothetical protein